jgi:hypothetical protein
LPAVKPARRLRIRLGPGAARCYMQQTVTDFRGRILPKRDAPLLSCAVRHLPLRIVA